MSHPTHYQAVPDESAPHGWKTLEGMFYRPDWGDRLETHNGQTFIVVQQVLSYTDRPNFQPPAIITARFG